MKFTATQFDGVLIIQPDVFRDQRGFFLESYNQRKYVEGGVPDLFVQDNHSLSGHGTIRGLHLQRMRPQAKLIRVLHGAIFDVVVDIRRGSASFCRWIGFELSSENFLQCYVPAGYAHGFCVLGESAEVEYKCSQFYDPADELAIKWDDPAIGVKWPVQTPMLSAKDSQAPLLKDLMDLLPQYKGK